MSENDEDRDEGLENVIVLTSEDGEDTEFELLDVVETDGYRYAVLLPVDDEDNGEVVIFRVEGEGDDETYVGVETEEEANKVFEIFKNQAKDRFDFTD